MKQVVSFSGGRTSAYLVQKLLSMYDKKDLDFVFMDTGAEHPKTYEFVKNVAKHFDITVTALRTVVSMEYRVGVRYQVVPLEVCQPDLKPWSDMVEKYNLPYIGGAFCTDRMKVQPFKKYCDETYGKGSYTTWLGIRADESHRLKDNEGFRYLAEISDFSKQDVLGFWAEMPFDLNLPEHLGNCVFCIKKGDGKIALAARDEPELYAQFQKLIAPKAKERTMYRKKRTLEDIVVEFRDVSTEDLRVRVKTNKRKEAGECTESCEVMGILQDS